MCVIYLMWNFHFFPTHTTLVLSNVEFCVYSINSISTYLRSSNNRCHHILREDQSSGYVAITMTMMRKMKMLIVQRRWLQILELSHSNIFIRKTLSHISFAFSFSKRQPLSNYGWCRTNVVTHIAGHVNDIH